MLTQTSPPWSTGLGGRRLKVAQLALLLTSILRVSVIVLGPAGLNGT